MSQPGGSDRRLGRRATEVHAGAPQVFALDERRPFARPRQGKGKRNAGLAGTDDYDVIAVHLFSSVADKRCSLREIQCKPHDTLLDIGFGSGALLPQTVGIVTLTALSL